MRVLTLLATLFLSVSLFAQNEEDAVKHTVNLLFDGMRKSDGAMIRDAFASGGILQTVIATKDKKTVVRTESIDTFAMQVSAPHKELYDERIVFETIKIDGDLAIVWAPYQFYLDDKFSHCGIDSFQLVKINGVWKIQYLIDTRKRDGCK